jgi:hypothetical protein
MAAHVVQGDGLFDTPQVQIRNDSAFRTLQSSSGDVCPVMVCSFLHFVLVFRSQRFKYWQ